MTDKRLLDLMAVAAFDVLMKHGKKVRMKQAMRVLAAMDMTMVFK